MKALRFALPLAFLALGAVGLSCGGLLVALPLLIAPIALLVLDWALRSSDGSGAPDHPRLHAALPRLYAAAQTGFTLWVTATLARHPAPWLEVAALALSNGFTAGVFGNLAAHELVHRPGAADRALGLTFLASIGYMHFRIAHIFGHHRHAATPADPASARPGESAYAFLVRSVAGQFTDAWRFERARLTARPRERGWWRGWRNRLVLYGAVELTVLAAAAAAGLQALIFFSGQAALAIVLLELFNYIAHYGLRRRITDGRLSRLGPHHSWNSARRMNNWSLFNMGRHGDHHRRPTAPYQALRAEPAAPELPFGYAGAIVLSLAPPLWRKAMDPRVALWSRVESGELTREAAGAAQGRSGSSGLFWPAAPAPYPECLAIERSGRPRTAVVSSASAKKQEARHPPSGTRKKAADQRK